MDKQISQYLKNKANRISELYKWDFNTSIPQERFGIYVEGESWFEKTISLKNKLRTYTTENPESLAQVAEYFITEWGGIRRFSKSREVVDDFRQLQGTAQPPKNFNPRFASVSSWSKWASLVCPRWACIYDARVAYSINVINYLNGGKHKIFPTPEGRNTRLVLLDVSTLLLEMRIKQGDGSSPKDVQALHFVRAPDAYLHYLELIGAVSQQIWNDRDHIHEVEMLLFSLADTDIYNDLFSKVGSANVRA